MQPNLLSIPFDGPHIGFLVFSICILIFMLGFWVHDKKKGSALPTYKGPGIPQPLDPDNNINMVYHLLNHAGEILINLEGPIPGQVYAQYLISIQESLRKHDQAKYPLTAKEYEHLSAISDMLSDIAANIELMPGKDAYERFGWIHNMVLFIHHEIQQYPIPKNDPKPEVDNRVNDGINQP